jgi:hypothetical protein
VAVTPLALMALGGPAVAAKPEVTHTTYTSAYADAYWSSGEGESYVEGGVHAALTSDGPELWVWQITPSTEGGFVETTLTGEGDHTFTIDKGRLGSASLVGEDLATETCTYDEEGTKLGECEPGSIDIDLTWTGEGKISRGGLTERFKGDGFSINVHVTSTDRAASVEGAITGAIDVEEFGEAMLGTYKQVETKRCVADACEEPEPEE